MGKEHNTNTKIITKVSGVQKLVSSVLFSAGVYYILSVFQLERHLLIILTWDAFCFWMIILNWMLFCSTTPEGLCYVVKDQDDGIKVIFIIVLLAVCFSVFSTFILLVDKNGLSLDNISHAIISLSPVFVSWILLHTIFTIRYAHLYHDHNELNTGSNIGGIDFPANTRPDYVDFAYFSFVIGMTFQVSDVVVSSRAIRRFVLMHSLISFVFNTIIVALTISAIASIKQ
ncbi:MAG: DUF1345 domain-containing protein [Bacteroidota bacterium]|nr:DUF1345 domain-containing protein [Bacteroidota bacterium]